MLSNGSGHQVRGLVIPYNAKIADINESDTNVHYLDLATALSETRRITGIIVGSARIAGTGSLIVYPNEAAYGIYLSIYTVPNFISLDPAQNRLKYSQSVANDDFDLYCFGYTVED